MSDLSYVEKIRHSSAHLLADAVKSIYGDKTQVTIGPVIENGFYYDFHCDGFSFSQEDLSKIEQKMAEIRNKNLDFKREEWSKADAIKYFESIGESFKVKIINDLNEQITVYKQGDFIDLCRGPHVENTKELKFFKLTKVSGSYWRGDSRGEKLQRIYGVAFETKKELDDYLIFLEESAKIDHRKLGTELELFQFSEHAPGDVFWLPKGLKLYKKIKKVIEDAIKFDYQEVQTPQIVNKSLWELSGHWENYKENMFITKIDQEEMDFAIKPMNCPCHVEIFNNQIRSYKDLPMRIAEFGKCYRYEPSGALHGLMRVRGMVQDDAHIFCTEDQIESETVKFYQLFKSVYEKFGFSDIKIKLATRPQKKAGSDEIWDKAENALKNALDKFIDSYEIAEGNGAFYGPKLEFHLKDRLGRSWQCGTFQLDFVLPQRLSAFYINENSEKVHPVMLHRAVLGTLERFIGILIEHYKGKFPDWLAPVHTIVIGVANKFDEFVIRKAKELNDSGIDAEFDISHETLGYKIRKYKMMKIPNIFVVGEKELKEWGWIS